MSNWIKSERTNGFKKFSRPEYINLRNQVLRIIGAIGGTPGLVASVNGRIGAVILTATDVGLDNVNNTSDIDKPVSTAQQTALDLKQDKYIQNVEYTSSRQLIASDNSKLIQMNLGVSNTLEIPLNSTVAFPIGTQILIAQKGLGQTTITGEVGVTINVSDARYKLLTRYSVCTIIKVDTNEWYLSGDLTA